MDEQQPQETPLPIDEADDDIDLSEPPRATRISPYAIAALVVATVGTLRVPAEIALMSFRDGQDIARLVSALILPIGIIALTFWLARMAEDEIFSSEGVFGGVGFFRAARFLAVVEAVTVLVSLAMTLWTRNQASFNVP